MTYHSGEDVKIPTSFQCQPSPNVPQPWPSICRTRIWPSLWDLCRMDTLPATGWNQAYSHHLAVWSSRIWKDSEFKVLRPNGIQCPMRRVLTVRSSWSVTTKFWVLFCNTVCNSLVGQCPTPQRYQRVNWRNPSMKNQLGKQLDDWSSDLPR